MSQTYSNLLSHVVLSTKDRKPSIDDEVKPPLLGYINGIEMKVVERFWR